MYAYEESGPFRRAMRRATGTKVIARASAPVMRHVDRLAYRLTGGRHTLSSWVTGFPVVMLTTTGAKSGRERRLPVLAVPDGESLIVIASNYGRRKHPSWYHNLRAHPRASVTVNDQTREVVVEETSGEERRRCWDTAVEVNPGFLEYDRRTPHREIGVFRLDPA